MSEYIVYRQQMHGNNRRYLTTFDSFRYEAELQGGEDFAVVSYNKAAKLANKYRKQMEQAAKDFKKKHGKAAQCFMILPNCYFGTQLV